jgi:hypothetical protein
MPCSSPQLLSDAAASLRAWGAGARRATDFARNPTPNGVTRATNAGTPPAREHAMAKAQKKSNKEIRKPKAEKPKKANASNPSSKGALPAPGKG